MDSQSTNDLRDFVPPEEAIYSRMTSPVDTTFIDVEKIGFVLKEIFFSHFLPVFSRHFGKHINGWYCFLADLNDQKVVVSSPG